MWRTLPAGKIRYVLTCCSEDTIHLDPNLQSFPESKDEDTDNIIVDGKKRENDDLFCRHILDTLYD